MEREQRSTKWKYEVGSTSKFDFRAELSKCTFAHCCSLRVSDSFGCSYDGERGQRRPVKVQITQRDCVKISKCPSKRHVETFCYLTTSSRTLQMTINLFSGTKTTRSGVGKSRGLGWNCCFVPVRGQLWSWFKKNKKTQLTVGRGGTGNEQQSLVAESGDVLLTSPSALTSCYMYNSRFKTLSTECQPCKKKHKRQKIYKMKSF